MEIKMKSEVTIATYCDEPHTLDKLHIREVSIDKARNRDEQNRLFIKLDGRNNKNGNREQLQIRLNKYDVDVLVTRINDCIKNGLLSVKE